MRRRALALACAAAVTAAGVIGLVPASASSPGASSSPLPTVTLTPAPLPTVTVAPGPTTPAAPAKKMTLAELRVAVQAVDAELTARTQQLEAGKAKLAASRQRLVVVTAAAKAAQAEAARAHVELGEYAAAAYRGQQISPVVTVLMGPPAEATDTLHNLQNLEQTGTIKTDITTYAAQTAAQAESLQAEAAALTADNAAATVTLAAERDQAKALAATTQKAFVAETERIAAAQLKAVATNCQKKVAIAETYPNGLIPLAALCSTGIGNFMLRGDAAIAFKKLAVAYKADLGTPICLESAYRNRALQAQLYANDQVMVAVPGHSHHGLGLATDLCGGIEKFGSKQHKWMDANAAKYGFFHPAWAEPNGVTPEPWHWEFKVASYPSDDGTQPAGDVS